MSVEAILDGKVLRAYWVKADVRVRARVVQVAKPVPYGAVLRAEDLREAVCEIEDPRADYVRTSGEAVGMTAKRALAPGDLLNRNWLNESRLVRNGETVRCLEQSGGIRITTARARPSERQAGRPHPGEEHRFRSHDHCRGHGPGRSAGRALRGEIWTTRVEGIDYGLMAIVLLVSLIPGCGPKKVQMTAAASLGNYVAEANAQAAPPQSSEGSLWVAQGAKLEPVSRLQGTPGE